MQILIAVAVLTWMGGAAVVVGLCNAAARGDRALATRPRPMRRILRRRSGCEADRPAAVPPRGIARP